MTTFSPLWPYAFSGSSQSATKKQKWNKEQSHWLHTRQATDWPFCFIATWSWPLVYHANKRRREGT